MGTTSYGQRRAIGDVIRDPHFFTINANDELTNNGSSREG